MISLFFEKKQMKYINKATAALAISLFSTISFSEEIRTINQPKTITGEFVVAEGNQSKYAGLEKDTSLIQIEKDTFGLKKFRNDMKVTNIKQRFKVNLAKLREDSSHKDAYPYENNK